MADTKCVLNQRQMETISISLGKDGRGTGTGGCGVVRSDSCVQLRGVGVSGRHCQSYPAGISALYAKRTSFILF